MTAPVKLSYVATVIAASIGAVLIQSGDRARAKPCFGGASSITARLGADGRYHQSKAVFSGCIPRRSR